MTATNMFSNFGGFRCRPISACGSLLKGGYYFLSSLWLPSTASSMALLLFLEALVYRVSL